MGAESNSSIRSWGLRFDGSSLAEPGLIFDFDDLTAGCTPLMTEDDSPFLMTDDPDGLPAGLTVDCDPLLLALDSAARGCFCACAGLIIQRRQREVFIERRAWRRRRRLPGEGRRLTRRRRRRPGTPKAPG